MELGLLFSKVEKKLNESYVNQTFNTEINNFKKVVISNKMLSECYYLYSNLTIKQGMSSDIAKEYFEDYAIGLYLEASFKENALYIKTDNIFKDIIM